MPLMNAGRRDCLNKMKRGAMLGGGVGGAAGFLFGSFEAAQIRGIPVSQVSSTSDILDKALSRRSKMTFTK